MKLYFQRITGFVFGLFLSQINFQMNVFKFGGASVKDANAVRNVSHILSLFPKDQLIVVVSAMGKTTNAMEEIVESLWNRNEKRYMELIEDRYQFLGIDAP